MTITIKINNPYLMNRAHNYFCNKNVQTMLCNNQTELTLFNLDRTETENLAHYLYQTLPLETCDATTPCCISK